MGGRGKGREEEGKMGERRKEKELRIKEKGERRNYKVKRIK